MVVRFQRLAIHFKYVLALPRKQVIGTILGCRAKSFMEITENRMIAGKFAKLVKEHGFEMSPLFAIPGFHFLMICIDVLHAVDLGVAQEIVGNVFYEALGTFAAGKNKTIQVANLQLQLKAHYRRMRTGNRIGQLTIEMLKKDGKAPKLRAKGGETRHVVPFALEIAIALRAAADSEHSFNVLQCVSALMDFYMCLGVRPFPMDCAREAGRKLSLSYQHLHEEATASGMQRWAVKPKHHIFMELIEFQLDELGDPMSYWCYRDEDHVGKIAHLGESRGGRGSAALTAARVIKHIRGLSTVC